jgi:acyl-CoA-binding protein
MVTRTISEKQTEENCSLKDQFNNFNTTNYLDESLYSDIKKGANNDNLSSISKYFKKGSNNKNEKITTGRIENYFAIQPNQNQSQSQNIEEYNQEEDINIINEEIKKMLDEVVSFKTNAYNKLKANKIEDAKKDYFSVIFINYFILFYFFIF